MNKLHDDRLSNSKCSQTKRANWNLFVTRVALRGRRGRTRSGRGKKTTTKNQKQSVPESHP